MGVAPAAGSLGLGGVFLRPGSLFFRGPGPFPTGAGLSAALDFHGLSNDSADLVLMVVSLTAGVGGGLGRRAERRSFNISEGVW